MSSEKKKSKPKIKISVDPSVTNSDLRQRIEALLFDEEPTDAIPKCFEEVYQTTFIMGLIFEDEKLGEVCANITFQLARLFDIYAYKYAEYDEEKNKVYLEYREKVAELKANHLKEMLEKVQKEQKKE